MEFEYRYMWIKKKEEKVLECSVNNIICIIIIKKLK